jgi:AcrR family transcriptional regulator
MTREESIRGDLRVQRTRNLIVEALIDLTIQKGFAAVTVQDIVRRAGINRATFYRHYQDKFDLLDQYVQAVYALPDNQSGANTSAGHASNLEKTASGLVKIFEHVRLHSKFFQVMLGENGDPAFTAKIRQFVRQRIRRLMPAALLSDENSADLYLNYISSGAVGVMSWWLENEMPYSPEQLSAILYRLFVSTLPTHALS